MYDLLCTRPTGHSILQRVEELLLLFNVQGQLICNRRPRAPQYRGGLRKWGGGGGGGGLMNNTTSEGGGRGGDSTSEKKYFGQKGQSISSVKPFQLET